MSHAPAPLENPLQSLIEGLAEAARNGSLQRASQQAAGGPHPDDDEIHRVARGKMAPDQALKIRAHTVLCVACSSRLAAARAAHLSSSEIAALATDTPISSEDRAWMRAHLSACDACSKQLSEAQAMVRWMLPYKAPVLWLGMYLELSLLLRPTGPVATIETCKPRGLLRELFSTARSLGRELLQTGTANAAAMPSVERPLERFRASEPGKENSGDSVILRGHGRRQKPLFLVVFAIEPVADPNKLVELVLPEPGHEKEDGVIGPGDEPWEILVGKASEPRCRKLLLAVISHDPRLHESVAGLARQPPVSSRLPVWLAELGRQGVELQVELVPYEVI